MKKPLSIRVPQMALLLVLTSLSACITYTISNYYGFGEAPPPLHEETEAIPNVIGGKKRYLPLEMIRIEPGSFFKIGQSWEKEGLMKVKPDDIKVTLTRAFVISKYVVTKGLWKFVMGTDPSHFKECGTDCPVEQIRWIDAIKFCNKLSAIEGHSPCYLIGNSFVEWTSCSGYRLPTEAEWEYMARGQDSLPYTPTREKAERTQVIPEHCNENKDLFTLHSVYCSLVNERGIANLFDSVSEWCWDFRGQTGTAEELVDPEGPEKGEMHVIRGRSWCYYNPNCVSAWNLEDSPGLSNYDLSFRVVRVE